MLEQIAAEEFDALVGQAIAITSAEATVHWELAGVRRLNAPSPRPQPPFVLTLRDNGAARSWPQGIYRLAHPQRGELDLFVVPVGPDGRGMCYEVTFN